MTKVFTIRHAAGRTTATIAGLPPGGEPRRRPYIIPIFIPMCGCAHRCSFCNQTVITGTRSKAPAAGDVARSIENLLPLVQGRGRSVQIAFYGGNFLGLPKPLVRALLTAAAVYVHRGDAGGIRFSTRPDTISPGRLSAVAEFPVTTIELGVQSLDDRVLTQARRGHDAACAMKAARAIKAAGFKLGLQMMTGLPGDTPQGALQTAGKMVALAPDIVRIYPTLVLKGSPLAVHFRKSAFAPATLRDTIDLVSRLFLRFTAAGIPVIRMGLQADLSLSAGGTVLAGPYHPALGEQVYSRVFYALAAAVLTRHPDRDHPIVLQVHPRHLSRMIGAGRANLRRLQQRFGQPSLSICGSDQVGPHHLEAKRPDLPSRPNVHLAVDKPPMPIASR